MERFRRSFRFDLTHSVATNLTIAGINVVTGIVVARLLQPQGRGELAAVFNWPNTLALLATLGLTESLVYFCAREPARSGRYLGSSLVLALGASGVLAVLGWLAMPWLLAAQSDSVVATARWYLLQVPVGAVLYLVIRPLRGAGDIRGWNYLRASHNVVWLLILAVAVIRGGATVEGLALAFLVGRSALVPINLIVVRVRLGQTIRPSRGVNGPMLRYGLPNLLAAFPSTLNMRLDQLLMAGVLPARELGLYVAAVSWSQLPSPIMLAYGTVLFPRVAEIPDVERQHDLAARGVRVGIAAAVALAALTLVLAPLAIPLLFGSNYRDAIPAGMVLAVASAFDSANTIQQETIRGLGRPNGVLWAQLGGLAVTLVGLVVLLRPLGIMGAAVASAVGYATIVAVLALYSAHISHKPLRSVVLPTRGDIRAVRAQLTRDAV